MWSLVLGETKKRINPQSFHTWLEPTAAVALSDDQLVVSVKNQFALDYIAGQYGGLLNDVARNLFEDKVGIAFRAEASEEPQSLTARTMAPSAGGREPEPATPVNLGQPLNPKYTFDTFVVGNSNQWAHAASMAVAETPAQVYNPLFIYGGVGLGKTHLMQAIGNSALAMRKLERVCYLSAETFMNQMVESLQYGKTLDFRNKYRRMDLLLIDDIQFLQGKDAT